MKIAYVIDALHTDEAGTESQLRLLIEGMQAKGNSVCLFVLRHTEYSQRCEYPCEIHEVGFHSFFSLASWKNALLFRQELQDRQIKVVHGFFNDVALLLPGLLSFISAKRFTSRRDMGIWYTLPKLWLLRINAVSECRIICNSLAVLRYTKEQEWLTADRMYCAYNALHENPATTIGSAAQALADRIKASPFITVCLVANIKPVKQIDTLVRAAAKVRSQTGQRVDYHIIGAIADQDCANKLRQLIDEHELSENFFLHGAVPGVRAMLSDFDIGVLTSSSEGLSNTVLEYLQAGLATVVSDTGGNPEMIDDGINGLLFVPGDSHQLAERLARLISDQDQRARLGNAAQESAQAFSVPAMSDAYEGIYRGTTDHWHANESP